MSGRPYIVWYACVYICMYKGRVVDRGDCYYRVIVSVSVSVYGFG